MTDPQNDEQQKPTNCCGGGCNSAPSMPPLNAPLPEEPAGGLDRRDFMKAAGATLGLAGLATAMAPLASWGAEQSLDSFLQQHYRELGPEELRQVCDRLEAETKSDYGADVNIGDHRPIKGVKFGYALNLSVCVGCRRCADACHHENNHDRESNQSYIRVFEMENGSIDFTHGDASYEHPTPQDGKYYLPVQCHQCDNAPCVSACPIEATWKEEDGIVVVDYNWCIGCRYCEAACPYHARRFNWEKPKIPTEEINPEQSYLSNRIRPQGVMEKCTFCLHRTRGGRLPACLEACPTGARVFGDLNDPESPIRKVLDTKRVFVLKEEVGTLPNFFYFFDK